MPFLSQKQEEENILNQTQASSQFSCNVCKRLAEEPVVTKCGHLFCWQCVCNYQLCVVCNIPITQEDFFPIYTNEQNNPGKNLSSRVKPKPKAKHIGKIKNAASLGSSNEFSALYSTLSDNIQRETLLAGNGYCPATVFTLIGETDEELEQMQIVGKRVQRKITALSWFLLFVVFGCVLLSLKMNKDSR